MDLTIQNIISKVNLEQLPEYNTVNNLALKMYNHMPTKETFHSKVITAILSINDRYDDKIFIFEFLKLLNLPYTDIESYKVKNEEYINGRYIDILITLEYKDKSFNAIIIENKLNDAIDQPNQLFDYYSGLLDKKIYQDIRIVYIPLDPYKSVNSINTTTEIKDKTTCVNLPQLITWLNESLNSICIKNSTFIQFVREYKLLLENISKIFINKMRIEELLRLPSHDLNKLIEISSVISSDDWHKTRLTELKSAIISNFFGKLTEKEYTENILIHGVSNEYLELYFEPSFWVEIWSYQNCYELYVCTDSKNFWREDFEYNESKNENHHYFKNKDKNKFSFPFPAENNAYTTLIEETILLLQEAFNYWKSPKSK